MPRACSVSNAVLDTLLGKGFQARFIEGGIEGWMAETEAKQCLVCRPEGRPTGDVTHYY